MIMCTRIGIAKKSKSRGIMYAKSEQYLLAGTIKSRGGIFVMISAKFSTHYTGSTRKILNIHLE